MACNNLLAYPDFNDKFKIHTNARYLQLLSVIIQEGKLISFYSIKLTDAQKRHTVTEKELLTIAETLKEFRYILLRKKLRIYTDNKKLTCKYLNTERVLIWILILEEYGLDIEYIQDDKNIVADA